ncbi:B12-binding domain-containing radical SAM protein [Spirochaetia bacterium]|nr:B12-binding domain-containing radical SAM protein [Spirochaetia bacterium]
MAQTDILLTTINAKWVHPSLALRLLKANLGVLEDRCTILEFALRQSLAEKLEPILAAAPRILGISVSIWNHKATVELLKALKERWGAKDEEWGIHKPVIILGGPEVSYLPEESEIFDYADWVIRGEGELAFLELCHRFLEKNSNTVQNSFTTGKFIDAPPVDLTIVESGYRLYTAEDLNRKLVYVEASRGCPFGCEFCQSAISAGVREFPPDRFLGEMERLIERGARGFKFLDRTFNLDIERARTIMEFFLERLQPSMYVHFEMVPARFPTELRELLRRFPAGSLRLEVGIQTFNSNTAALIGRLSNPEKELETLHFLRQETRAIVHADLIAGLPGEDMASFGQGFDLLWQARPTEIQLGILKCLPGTPIARHTKTYNMTPGAIAPVQSFLSESDPKGRMVYAPEPPYEVLETADLSAADLDRIKNFARFWELIVNRGVFPDLVPKLFPEGQPVFERFMALSDALLARFGRNWGIDRSELREAVDGFSGP